jgi:hypothetical protein
MPDRHCCATCIHIGRVTANGGARFRCTRLGWETRPEWRFHCWTERPRTVKMKTVAVDPPSQGQT